MEQRADADESLASGVPALVGSLGELPSIVLSTDAVDEVVWETAMLAVRAHEPTTSCGVTVLRDGHPVSLVPDRAEHNALEQSQYAADTGPVPEALRSRAAVVVADTADEPRWPEFAAAAAEQGIGSCCAAPMFVGDRPLGVISYYAAAPHAYEADFLLGGLIADLAATGLWCLLKHADKQQLDEQLRQALTSRADIDQAKGILMAQRGCTPDEAFDLLREQSQRHNVKLREVAARVVRRTTGAT
ncbi:ANTAR domain-containing protein [Saccharopolyspora sp. NPDC047091]|uniref:GAF and ANTAR domain-containing protein n=1 Tax=Saccharopolyspora sp. NPDC047091 TaxID=3155924 RepID=UPI0033FE1453